MKAKPSVSHSGKLGGLRAHSFQCAEPKKNTKSRHEIGIKRDRPDSGSTKSGTEGVISKHRITILQNMTKKTPSQLLSS
ncbi:MAG: hypothetical protein OXC46_12085, partial [Thaumarchaeota archaeon]|nr:hypothetical protein [Nitrososphaerota archaeon]